MKLRRRPSEADLDAELSAYLELAIHENIRSGMSPKQPGAPRCFKLKA